MSPFFGNKEEKAEREAAAKAVVERLLELPVAELAAEILPAFNPGAVSGSGGIAPAGSVVEGATVRRRPAELVALIVR